VNRLNHLYGDAVGDLKPGTTISSSAYNSIKETLRRETKKGVRAHAGKVEAERRATHQRVLDNRTERLLLKIINTGIIDEVFPTYSTHTLSTQKINERIVSRKKWPPLLGSWNS
jgi:hypothetical protein